MTEVKDSSLMVKRIIGFLSVAMCAFQLYTAAIAPLAAMAQRSGHYGFALALIFLWASIDEKHRWMRVLDYFLAALGAIINLYVYFDWLPMSFRTTALIPLDYVFGTALIVLALWAAYKKTGIWLPLIAIFFILYTFVGPYIKGYFWFPKISYTRFISYLFMGSDGIFGSCLDVSATVCFIFCLFGEVLVQLGAGKFLIDISYSLFGRIRGGSGKIAVVACSLFGMVSGSATSNVAATGSLTIPMMKRHGFTGEDAGGICAASAVGGMLMPPVMGSAAFIMASMVNSTYGKICVAAFVPAVLYYASLFLKVDLRAQRYGMKSLSKEELPRTKDVLKEGWHFLIGLGVLIILLVVLQWSATKAAFWSMVVLVLSDIVKRLVTKQKLTEGKVYLNILVESAKGSLLVAAATGCAGIIVGIFGATTLNLRLSNILINLSGGNVVVLLILTAIGALILGMGLPALSVYLVLAIVVAPALIKMEIPLLAAHMFLFFYSNMAGVTPPVGAAFYVSSGIAQSDTMRTGGNAFLSSIAGYLIPFVFVFNQGLFLDGGIASVLWCIFATTVGTVALVFGLEGFMFGRNMNVLLRAMFIVAAILTIIPETITTLCGFVVLILLIIVHRFLGKKVIAS